LITVARVGGVWWLSVRVIAHYDWDGVVSALFLAPESAVEVAHYDELDSVAGPPPRLFTEVHRPSMLAPGDVLVDHHTPTLPGVPATGLTGYVVVVGEGGYSVVVSRNEGRDYSNVRGVRSLYGMLPEPLADTAVRPPEDIARLSDVLDNPVLARSTEEIEVVLGYDVAWERVRRWLARARPGPERVADLVYEALGVFQRVGRRVGVQARLPSGSGPLLLVGDGGWYARTLLKLAQFTQERPLYAVADPWRPSLYRVLLVSRGDAALRVAASLGGGGRPAPGGGTVAGATAPLQAVIAAIESVVGRPQVVRVRTPENVEERRGRLEGHVG